MSEAFTAEMAKIIAAHERYRIIELLSGCPGVTNTSADFGSAHSNGDCNCYAIQLIRELK
jgi:tRNA-dihydrouridine synthase